MKSEFKVGTVEEATIQADRTLYSRSDINSYLSNMGVWYIIVSDRIYSLM